MLPPPPPLLQLQRRPQWLHTVITPTTEHQITFSWPTTNLLEMAWIVQTLHTGLNTPTTQLDTACLMVLTHWLDLVAQDHTAHRHRCSRLWVWVTGAWEQMP